MIFNYVTCSNCDFKASEKEYFNIAILPRPGVFKSEIRSNYCDDCQCITKWFLGKAQVESGLPVLNQFQISDRRLDIKTERHKVHAKGVKLTKKINQLENSSFFNRMFNSVKLSNLKKELSKTKKEVSKYDYEIKFHEKSNKNGNAYYNTIKPKPKCLECGSEKYIKIPEAFYFLEDSFDIVSNTEVKHHCGGYLRLEHHEQNIKINYKNGYNYIYEYNEFGVVNKIKVNRPGWELVKTKKSNYRQFILQDDYEIWNEFPASNFNN